LDLPLGIHSTMGGPSWDIVTPLDICIDLLIQSGGIEPEFGQKERLVPGYALELGGSACIFASQAAKLGLRVLGLGEVGSDPFGEFALATLRLAGVDCVSVRIGKGVQTGIGVAICKDDGDRAILTFLGSIDGARGSDFTQSVLAGARHVHISSYYLMKSLRPALPDILARARSLGLSTSLDTNWDPDEKWMGEVEEILPFIDVLLPNQNEVLALGGSQNLELAIDRLADIVPTLAVKLGERGSLVRTRGEEIRLPARNVRVVDTVGAGDSFDAGFIYGWLNGRGPRRCLEIANACGGLSTEAAGGTAAQPTGSRLAEFLGGAP